jgi:hypothetical protein
MGLEEEKKNRTKERSSHSEIMVGKDRRQNETELQGER